MSAADSPIPVADSPLPKCPRPFNTARINVTRLIYKPRNRNLKDGEFLPNQVARLVKSMKEGLLDTKYPTHVVIEESDKEMVEKAIKDGTPFVGVVYVSFYWVTHWWRNGFLDFHLLNRMYRLAAYREFLDQYPNTLPFYFSHVYVLEDATKDELRNLCHNGTDDCAVPDFYSTQFARARLTV